MAMHDHLRRTTRPLGIVDAHPFLDVDLVELVLGLPPEHAFDPVLNRPLLRTAMRGLVPDGVRLRREKVYFDRLLGDALTGPDRTTIDAVMADASLELAAIGDPTRVRALWSDGPSRHPRGPRAWASEVWRVFAAETWLRREAGREVPLAPAAEA
jgi:asparagine synthase (glutamine-hydrolysing)